VSPTTEPNSAESGLSIWGYYGRFASLPTAKHPIRATKTAICPDDFTRHGA
jgi:hypothetical protein